MSDETSSGSPSHRQAKGTGRPAIAALTDRLLPGPGTAFDRLSQASHDTVRRVVETPVGRPTTYLLRGNEWLGHPLHPVVIAVPIGAWVVSSWYDLRGALDPRPEHDHAADGALRIGVVGSVAAAVTGVAQYLDTHDGVRRETTLHAGLNTAAHGMYLASWALRARGRRPLGRGVAAAALGVVSLSGYLGGDIAFRHGVGVTSGR